MFFTFLNNKKYFFKLKEIINLVNLNKLLNKNLKLQISLQYSIHNALENIAIKDVLQSYLTVLFFFFLQLIIF